jgi:hypothetical protein
MPRLIIEDVTLLKGKELMMYICFRGGATRTVTMPRPAPAWALRRTNPEVVAEIDRLLDDYTDVEIARVLNERGFHSKARKPVDIMMVAGKVLKNSPHKGGKVLKILTPEGGKVLKKSSAKGPYVLRTDSMG